MALVERRPHLPLQLTSFMAPPTETEEESEEDRVLGVASLSGVEGSEPLGGEGLASLRAEPLSVCARCCSYK